MERETGFEPATLSLGSAIERNSAATKGFQTGVSADKSGEATLTPDPSGTQPSTTDAALPNGHVAPVLRPSTSPAPARAALRVVDGANGHLLSVRTAAARLGVSTATVYKLCGAGTLPHVRIGNAIRVDPGALAAFVVASGH